MIICMIRHGQTDWNINTLLQGRTDIPLNVFGKEQARAVGRHLAERDPDWDFILSSPLSRAIKTAEMIAEEIGYDKEIIIVPEATERNFGSLEGSPLNDAMYDLLEKGHPEVETKEALFARAKSTLLKIIEKYRGKKVLLVSHAQFIKAALVAVDPNFDFRFPLKNSSLNYLEVKDGKIEIKDFNIIAQIKSKAD